MSAIVGIYNLDDHPVPRSDIERMVDILAHRGPDGAAVWCEGAVGFGHRMLHTTPESLHEVLPLVDKTRDVVLTADARIDNRDELMEALGLATTMHGELSDSQLILSAYVKWGEDCPNHLLGDFAFAIWDNRGKKLFCARDHFGIKPFYYHYAPGEMFAFSTEIKALLCLSKVPRHLNETRVAEHLAGITLDPANTFYQEILRLPAGHVMIISEEFVLRPYYSLDPSRELELKSDQEYEERFKELFTEAVRCRLRSAQSVGAMLSGGLDSSAIACTARDLLSSTPDKCPLHTFSWTFTEVPQCDELPYVNAVLAQGGFNSHFVPGDKRGPLTEIDDVLWHQDEAFDARGLCFSWDLYRSVKKQGVHVLLDGHGGDEVVSPGLDYLHKLADARQWWTLYDALRAVHRHGFLHARPLTTLLRMQRSQLEKHPIGKTMHWLRSRVSSLLWSQSEGKASTISQRTPKLRDDFIDRIGFVERCRRYQRSNARKVPTTKKVHYQAVTGSLQPLALETLDKLAAAFAIEPRYPLWDKRVVEFCLSIPAEQKLRHGWARSILRRGMAGVLPPKVQWRHDKMDFTPRISRGLLKYDRERLRNVLLQDLDNLEPYANVTAIRDIHERYDSGQSDDSVSDLAILFPVVTLSIWLRNADLPVAGN